MKRRLVKARITLSDTLQEILEVNKKRKKDLEFQPGPGSGERQMQEELRVLNKIAHRQAQLIRYYEDNLRDSA